MRSGVLLLIVVLLCLVVVGSILVFSDIQATLNVTSSQSDSAAAPALIQPTAVPELTFPPPIKNKYP